MRRSTRPIRRVRRSIAASVAGALLVLFGCRDDRAGLEVDVRFEPPASPPEQAGVRTFTTDRGYTVTLTRGYLAISAVEILPCASATAPFEPWRWLVGTRPAYAHSVETPTRLGTPVVAPLLANGAEGIEAGTLRPPPGAYCRVRISVAPADADALGLPSDLPMVRKSVVLEGTYRAPGRGAPASFAAEGTLAFDATVDAPFELSEHGRRSVVLVIEQLGDHWFDGIDFASAAPDAIARGFLQNAQGSFRVTVL